MHLFDAEAGGNPHFLKNIKYNSDMSTTSQQNLLSASTKKQTSSSIHDHQDNNRAVCSRLADLEAQGQGAAAQESPSQQKSSL